MGWCLLQQGLQEQKMYEGLGYLLLNQRDLERCSVQALDILLLPTQCYTAAGSQMCMTEHASHMTTSVLTAQLGGMLNNADMGWRGLNGFPIANIFNNACIWAE